jgi:predicted N-acetyltransferase YhbS
VDIIYQLEPQLSPAEFIDVLERSTLAERRPVHDPEIIRTMLANADIILTARLDGKLVGVSRAISDFAFCTYLSDLAVDVEVQRQGIGKELIRRTHEVAGMHSSLVLLAAPKAQTYYPHIGMTKHESCWVIPRAPKSQQ